MAQSHSLGESFVSLPTWFQHNYSMHGSGVGRIYPSENFCEDEEASAKRPGDPGLARSVDLRDVRPTPPAIELFFFISYRKSSEEGPKSD